MIGIGNPQADRTSRRTNDLYWHSDRTVGEIATEVGVTRSGLYSALEPLEAEGKCPGCGGRLGYTTRTSRASGTATCESCGLATQLEDAAVRDRGSRIAAALRARVLPIPRRRVMMIGGAAALGAVVGTVVACAIRDA